MADDSISVLVDLSRSWLWLLPPDRFRVASMIFAMLAKSGPGAMRLPVGSLAIAARVSSKTIMRTAEDMAESGSIVLTSNPGRKESTYVQLTGLSEVLSQVVSKVLLIQARESLSDSDTAAPELSKVLSEVREETQGSAPKLAIAVQGSVQGFPKPSTENISAKSDSVPIAVQGSVQGFAQPSPTVSDRARARSEKERDLFSDLGQPHPSEDLFVPTSASEDPTKIDELDGDPKDEKPLAFKTDKIRPFCWRAADRFRDRVLSRYPTSVLAGRGWGGEKGLRAKWANTFRLLVETDKRNSEEIGKVITWLFDAPNTFVVMSPDALREKWDRIVANMLREPQRAPSGDTRPAPVFRVIAREEPR